MSDSVRVQREDFDLSREVATLRDGDAGVGAVCAFVGTVRDMVDGDTSAQLTLEHYPGMTEKSLAAMAAEARRRFDIRATRIVHRVGPLALGEQIVLVAVTSAHRRQAFLACEFLMDYLKTQAPFWKKESSMHGERWVDARAADDQALARWGLPSGNAS